MEVIGTEGRLTLNRPFIAGNDGTPRRVLFHPPDGGPDELAFADSDAYQDEVEDMHAAILDGKPPYVSLEETRNHIRTVLALYESARLGQPVTL